MGKWDFVYRAGDDWDDSRDVAAAGFIREDCQYCVSAYAAGNRCFPLEAGTPVWAVFGAGRSFDAKCLCYEIYYQDDWGDIEWLDGGDRFDIEGNQYIQWDEDIFSELEPRYVPPRSEWDDSIGEYVYDGNCLM